MKLTEDKVRKLRLPAGKTDHIEFDDELEGFGLRLRGKRRAYVFQYMLHGKTYRLTLGQAPATKCEEARTIAKAMQGNVAKARLGLGMAPHIERENIRKDAIPKAPQATLGARIADYLEIQKEELKPRSYAEKKYRLEVLWRPLHLLPAAKINRADVSAQVSTIARQNGRTAANRARADLSSFYKWSIEMGHCEQNPIIGSRKEEERPERDRVLDDKETAAVWRAAGDSNYGRIVRLLTLTGCRRDEIGGLQWSEVDLENKTILLPADRTKNGRKHLVALSDPAFEILNSIPRQDRKYVFSDGEGFAAWSGSKKRLDKVSGVKNWRLHDLRRTVATRMADLGVQPHVIEAALNHISGHKAGVAGVYNRSTYEAERKAALKLWADYLQTIVSPINRGAIKVRAVLDSEVQPERPRASFAERLAGKWATENEQF